MVRAPFFFHAEAERTQREEKKISVLNLAAPSAPLRETFLECFKFELFCSEVCIAE
jgi:hypothetical protein